ncbi:MAG: histidine phosphatase family protein [Ligilactobacillus sp.]|nr:histidine phosphatase family protein [Ligilactobacillus sp.]
MTTFYLVRHGRTEYNRDGRLQGAVHDSPLLPQSIADAKQTGKALADIDFVAAFSSPQKRALDTGKNIVAQFKAPLQFETLDDLKEFDFGIWDGDLATKHQADRIWQTFLNDPLNFDGSAIKAESYSELAKRVKRALTQIAKRYPTGNVLVTAHALVITFGVKHLLGKDLNTIRREGLVANTSVTVLEAKDHLVFELLKWNDTTHLK